MKPRAVLVLALFTVSAGCTRSLPERIESVGGEQLPGWRAEVLIREPKRVAYMWTSPAVVGPYTSSATVIQTDSEQAAVFEYHRFRGMVSVPSEPYAPLGGDAVFWKSAGSDAMTILFRKSRAVVQVGGSRSQYVERLAGALARDIR